MMLVLPDSAHAAAVGGGGFLDSGTNFLNALLGVLTNTWVRIIAIISVIAMGILSMAGRLSMGLAMLVFLGMVLIFGAAAIVDSVEAVV
jgi:type IV secretion system protein VirB2